MGDQCVCVCVCVCVFIKLHITAQPGPVKLIFQYYSNGSTLWGISVCVCVCVCSSHEPIGPKGKLSLRLDRKFRHVLTDPLASDST